MIRRARRRPRKRSCAWATVAWVMRRQAALMILTPDVKVSDYGRWRRWICTVDGRQLSRVVARKLHLSPDRRFTQ